MTGKELADLRMELGLSQEDFAKHLDISRTYLAKNEAAKEEEIPHQLEFRAKKAAQELKVNPIPSLKGLWKLRQQKVEEPEVPYGKSKPGRIGIFNVDATMTPIEVFNDQTTVPSYYIEMPAFADCDFGINVYGHSMYPTIESGMVALCKELQDKSIIAYGEIYFLVTKDFRMVKRVLKSERKGYIIASSDNHNGHASPDGKTYAPIEISLDKILHIYMVKGCFKRYMI